MRIHISDEAGQFLESLKRENSERKIDAPVWAEIVGLALLSIKKETWEKLVAQKTPDSYFIEQALKDPKLSAQVSAFIQSKLSNSPLKETAKVKA